MAVGPGQPNAWTPILIDDDTPWVTGYDGLFGLDTEDRLAGERAPAGPKWARDGRPRQSWIDPIAFAGLDSTPPPGRMAEALAGELRDLRAGLDADRAAIAELERASQRLGVRVAAAQRAGRSEAFVAGIAAERDRVVAELRGLRVRVDGTLAAIERQRGRAGPRPRGRPGRSARPPAPRRPPAGPGRDPPQPPARRLVGGQRRPRRPAAGRAAHHGAGAWWVGLVVIAAGYVVIEALVRRRFLRLLLDLTILLAIVGAAILLYTSLVLFVALGLLAIGFIILRDNVRELRQA